MATASPKYLDEYETLLTDNRIWKQRLVNVGVVTPERADALGFTGAMLRGSGIAWDLRKKQPYAVYDRPGFRHPGRRQWRLLRPLSGAHGRNAPVNRIIKQCIDWLRKNPGPVITDNHKVAPPSREKMKANMEELIHHFKLFTEGIHVPEGEAYAASSTRRASSASGFIRRRQQALPHEDCAHRARALWRRWTRWRGAT